MPEPPARRPPSSTPLRSPRLAVAGKLKVLPEQASLVEIPKSGSNGSDEDADADVDEDDDEDLVYNQLALIPQGTARRDAQKLTKKKAKSLPRVTAYATAASYRMADLMKFFNARRSAYHTNPRMIDEVLYTTYAYEPSAASDEGRASKNPPQSSRTGDLLGIPELREDSEAEEPTQTPKRKKRSFFDAAGNEAEIFLFQYGTVVLWGMTEPQERRFLSTLKKFEVDKLPPHELEMEDLNFYYANYSRIYNDVITLRRGSSYMTKLSLSHALSQSVKISLFEQRISNTIEETKDIPEIISETGKIGMPHSEIMQKIGQLFLLRNNINSVGSVLDSPEVFWSFPDLQPLYDAARSYLEIPQRINLLNTRVEVLQDLLQLLKESVSSRHAERLEQVVIALIGIEIVLGVITILVDLLL
ncbi:hypothetical protein BD626DRAFT_559094 [Schizophyllum amplum]|uniref:DUF155 domain-containing protein n=1 Tax=Schizophyllum amplum TaxID=97359 RepID=A0A550C6H2_9AGAR|nr:hypothetical protein BD626DRAFT_559094 [Auriculariopsis ampla]